MRFSQWLIIIFFAVYTISLPGCIQKKCLKDISVSKQYINKIDNLANYCKILSAAFNNDVEAFKFLLDLDFYDGLSYEHGYVLSIVVDSLGEDTIVKLIDNKEINNERLKVYLGAGQDWRNSGKHNKDFIFVEDQYPLIFRELD